MIVHIRRGTTSHTLCGERGPETISEFHYYLHVLIEKGDCCKELYERLCPNCMRIYDANFASQGQ